MTDPAKSIPQQQVDIDWDAPELQELLGKIEGLRLDNRGMFKHRPVEIRTYWPEARLLGRGTLVANDGRGNWTLLTTFPLEPGIGLMVGQTLEELESTVRFLCDVRSCRRGMRQEDHDRSIFVSYLECHHRRAEGLGESR